MGDTKLDAGDAVTDAIKQIESALADIKARKVGARAVAGMRMVDNADVLLAGAKWAHAQLAYAQAMSDHDDRDGLWRDVTKAADLVEAREDAFRAAVEGAK